VNRLHETVLQDVHEKVPCVPVCSRFVPPVPFRVFPRPFGIGTKFPLILQPQTLKTPQVKIAALCV
jgi:hypothetical protein